MKPIAFAAATAIALLLPGTGCSREGDATATAATVANAEAPADKARAIDAAYLAGPWCFAYYEAGGERSDENIDYVFRNDGTLLYQNNSGSAIDREGSWTLAADELAVGPAVWAISKRIHSVAKDRFVLGNDYTQVVFQRGACAGGGAMKQMSNAGPVPPAAAAPGSSITLGPDEYRFQPVLCDLSGQRPDGLLLRGSGTAPDGRRFTVIVERLKPGDVAFESATFHFGSIVEGDMWVASRYGQPGGRWLVGDDSGATADGPLLRIDGDTLAVEGEFRHETSDAAQAGMLHATCSQ
ncbi:MAG TPA: hypothetical protein VFM73_04070 [Xanthomonadaceae bacterium]|nr:hypothetical protein [Xanthomonadaceae bacterium]